MIRAMKGEPRRNSRNRDSAQGEKAKTIPKIESNADARPPGWKDEGPSDFDDPMDPSDKGSPG
jgi:hypothetical protein